MARKLNEDGVPLPTIESALLLASLRRRIRPESVMGRDICPRQCHISALAKSRCSPLMGRGFKVARSGQGRANRRGGADP